MPYDAEIEFAISKNGTDFYQEEYVEVGNMMQTDARIIYYDHGKDLRPEENWHYAVEMAHGKYVLLVSDEDDVLWGALEYYFKLFRDNPEVNLVRASARVNYGDLTERRYGKKGLDAFHALFLKQNYLSGLIVRREDFLQEHLMELERFWDNAFYRNYPHEWWCAILSRKGDCIEDPVMLVDEKDAVLAEEVARGRKEDASSSGKDVSEKEFLPGYATYEERLNQFRGQIDFLRWFMKDDKEGLELGLGQAFFKTSYLLEMARDYHYHPEQFEEYVDRFLWMCMEAIDEIPLDEDQKARLLQCAKHLGMDSLETHKNLTAGNTEKEIK